MRAAFIGGLMVFLAGCSAAQINPEPKGQQLIVTPNNDVSVQLISSQQMQEMVANVKPVGNKWKSIKLDVAAGRPITKSVHSHFSALFPSTRVGDRDDGLPSSVRVELVDASVVAGTNDSATHNTGMFIPVVLFVMNAEALASVTVYADVSYCGEAPQRLSVTGDAAETMNYSAIGLPEIERLLGDAIDNSARLLVDRVNLGLKECSTGGQRTE